MAFANRLYVRTFIPEPRLGHVRQGQAVSVRVDAFPGRTFAARITEIAPDAEFTPKAVETRAERVNLVYAAKADLDDGWNAPLVPGQPAEVVVEMRGGAPHGQRRSEQPTRHQVRRNHGHQPAAFSPQPFFEACCART